MANTVNFKIQLEVDGQQRVVNATADIGNLKKELGAAEKSVSKLHEGFNHLANVSMALDGVTNTIGQMQRGLQELTNAYAVQEQNEKRLETVMRERMDASAADIQQMKELASAQQDIGVIGDEVQAKWERMRILASIVIQPHVKGKMKPERLLPLPWDKKKGKKQEAPKETLSAEAQKARLMKVLERERVVTTESQHAVKGSGL